MYEDEEFPEVDHDVLDLVDLIESVLDGVYAEDADGYRPLDFNED